MTLHHNAMTPHHDTMTSHYDLLIRHASITDGTGAAAYDADLAITGDRIVYIGDLSHATADNVIDATGLDVVPGFIDAHTHDDRMLLSGADMSAKVSQGVTTIVGGNCGISLAPMPRQIPNPVTPPLDLLDDTGKWFHFKTFAQYVAALQAQPAATNCALLVGHTTLRVATMQDLTQPATPDQILAMQGLVEEALRASEQRLKKSHEELEHRIQERTQTLQRTVKALCQSQQQLAEAQRIAHLGNWDWNLVTGEVEWSDEMYRVFGFAPQAFKMSFELFLERIHPDDREQVAARRGVVGGKVFAEVAHGALRRFHEPDEVAQERGFAAAAAADDEK